MGVRVREQVEGQRRDVSINIWRIAWHTQAPEVPPPLVLDKRGLVCRDAWLLEALAAIIYRTAGIMGRARLDFRTRLA